MPPAAGGKESLQKAGMSSSPRREHAYEAAPEDHHTDILVPESARVKVDDDSNRPQTRTHSSAKATTPKSANMEEKPPEKPKFSWSRIRESPAFAAHLSHRDASDRLTYSSSNRLLPLNSGLEIKPPPEENQYESDPETGSTNYTPTADAAAPRPTSSVYEDDILAPVSSARQTSNDRDVISLPCLEKKHITFSRPSSPGSYGVPPAPDREYDNAESLQLPTPMYRSSAHNDSQAEAQLEAQNWEGKPFDFPRASASSDCTPSLSLSPSAHHHPGELYQPPTHHEKSPTNYHRHSPPTPPSAPPPTPLPPLYHPRRPPRNRRTLPSFLLPTFIFPHMRKKYRQRLSGALFALFFVGSLGTGIGFLIAGVGDNRRVGDGKGDDRAEGGVRDEGASQSSARIPWMIAAGGSILGLHGAFMIVMFVVYGPRCF